MKAALEVPDALFQLYAYRRDMDENRDARAALQRLYSDRVHRAIPWPCVHMGEK